MDNKTFHLPKSVVLELTYRCNHICKFCSCPWEAPDNSYPVDKELTVDEWKRVIDILYSKGIEMFSISGGEVLLKEGFDEILTYIREKGEEYNLNHAIVLISNGLRMNQEYLKLFKKLNIHLSMSLPGYSTFQAHTGIDNADSVLKWFKEAKAIGLNTTLNVTVTALNYDELFETVSLGLLNGANDVLLNRFLPGGRGLSHLNELRLSTKQINGMLDIVEEVLTYSNRYGQVGTEIPLCSIDNAEKYMHISIGYQCAAAKGFFVIDPSGKIRTCNHSPRVVGHIFDTSIINDINYWNMFYYSKYQPTECDNCGIKRKCDCGCREVANILHGRANALDSSIIINQSKYEFK